MMRFPRWIFSVILALQLLLSVLQLLDAHGVWYFPMIHGLAYSLRFDLGFSLLPALLPVSALVLGYLLKEGKYRGSLIAVCVSIGLYLIFGIEAAVAWFSIFQIALALLHFLEIGEFLFWLLAFMTGFEATALIHWVLLPFGVITPLAWCADLELAMFYILAPLAPFVVITIFLIVIFKLLAPQYLTVLGKFFRLYSSPKVDIKKETIHLHPQILLLASLALSIVGALYPYNRNINPNGIAFGVDVHYYIDWMGSVNQNLLSAFTVANGSRPVMLWLIYLIQQGLGLKLLDAIKYLPVLLNPLLILSTFFMISQATEDQEWAGLASLFTASGFQITVGMYSYFLTNVLGLSLIFFALGFLFRTIQTGNKSNLIPASMLGSIAVYTHPWTFAQYYAATVAFLAYTYIRKKHVRESRYILIYLVATGIVNVLKGATGGLEAIGAIVTKGPKLIELTRFWSNNIFAFRQMYGGFLSNTVLLVLAAYGVYIYNRSKPYQVFLTHFLLLSLMYYFLVESHAQTKLLFNIPFGVLGALGILFLIRDATFIKSTKKAILLFVGAYMLVYLLRSIANLI